VGFAPIPRRVSTSSLAEARAGWSPLQGWLGRANRAAQTATETRVDDQERARALRRPGSDEHFGNLDPCHPALEVSSVDGIAIAQEVLRRGVPREGLDDLPGRPLRCRVFGDVEMHNAPPRRI